MTSDFILKLNVKFTRLTGFCCDVILANNTAINEMDIKERYVDSYGVVLYRLFTISVCIAS